MKIESLTIPAVKLITPTIFRDPRGFFSETYNAKILNQGGIEIPFVQDNHSLSVEKGVVRGLHFQTHPHAQDKLVRVVRGAIFDVAVDIRDGSPTFGQHVSVILSADNWQQLLVPKGFAHGFCTIEPNTEVVYKVSDYYAPECDKGMLWNDPVLGIDWPVRAGDAILSDKDRKHPGFAESQRWFAYSD